MHDFFVNPWTMAAGALAVSVPIIIHLINRLRYKKIHWAAMEFLLKAQKRMKRKLILQQLLLLLLRCLMVFLLGLLAARFLGFSPLSGRETRTTVHLAILDDSPSMADGWREDNGNNTDSFSIARTVLTEQIVPAASFANNPQLLEVMKLSTPGTIENFDRVNAESLGRVKTALVNQKPSTVRGSMAEALRKAKAAADKDGPDRARVVHILSDFRGPDWEIDGPQIKTAIDELTRQKVKVHLIDVAHPYRKDERKTPLFHDNVAIIDLAPSRRVVPRFEQTEFTLRVRNFGNSEMKDLRFAIAVNGDDNKGQSVVIPTLGAQQEEQIRFKLMLDRVGSAEKPLERFSIVSARLETPEPGGLAVDNVRHTAVEVRERLPILAIDGRPAERDTAKGDSIYLRNIFTDVSGGFRWEAGAPSKLETDDLSQYSCILLLNQPALTPEAVEKLERYVREGGGVGFFLGPDIKREEYNKLLYRDGNGLFPAMLPEQPSPMLTKEMIDFKRENRSPRFVLRDKAAASHEALFGFYYNERGREDRDTPRAMRFFMEHVVIARHWPIARFGKFTSDPTIKELFCLPNENRIGDYQARVEAFAEKIPADDSEFVKYQAVLASSKKELLQLAKSTEPLYRLATAFDRLLRDQLSEGDAAEPLLREFWANPKNTDLKKNASEIRDLVKFGDPLYIAKTFGRGRVTVFTTTAGPEWNDWATGLGGGFYSIIMSQMEKFLSGGAAGESYAAGSTLAISVDANRYRPAAGRSFLTVDYSGEGKTANARPAIILDRKSQPMEVTASIDDKGVDRSQAKLDFTESELPGVYMFTLTRVRPASAGAEAAEVPEYRSFVVNVDAVREGDLRRASRDDIVQQSPGAALHAANDSRWLDELKNKTTDMTEAGWIFLVLLLVLVTEQALATMLSHNTASSMQNLALSAAQSFPRAVTKPEASNAA